MCVLHLDQADTGNSVIRKVIVFSGLVTTLAGTPLHPGAADGAALASSFNAPVSIAVTTAEIVVVVSSEIP